MKNISCKFLKDLNKIMRVFLLLILLCAHLLEGEVNLPAVMQKVAKNVKNLFPKNQKTQFIKRGCTVESWHSSLHNFVITLLQVQSVQKYVGKTKHLQVKHLCREKFLSAVRWINSKRGGNILDAVVNIYS